MKVSQEDAQDSVQASSPNEETLDKETPTEIQGAVQANLANEEAHEEAQKNAQALAQSNLSDPQNERSQDVAKATVPAIALDDVTREIFHEEFTEQLSLIHDCLAKWHKTAQAHSIHDHKSVHPALADIRRAFHTLKGSGRMVGATALGDFAWEYEAVLNQVLGGVCQPNQALYDVLSEAWQGLHAHTNALLINNQLPADLLAQQAHIQQWLAVSLSGDQVEASSHPSHPSSPSSPSPSLGELERSTPAQTPIQTITAPSTLTEQRLATPDSMERIESSGAQSSSSPDTAPNKDTVMGDQSSPLARSSASTSSVYLKMPCLDPEICESLCDELIPLLAKLKVLQDSIAEDESRIPLLQTHLKSVYALLLPLSDSPLTALFAQLSQLSKQQWQAASTQTTLQTCLTFVEDYLSQCSTIEQLADCEQALNALNPQVDEDEPSGVENFEEPIEAVKEAGSAEDELEQLANALQDEPNALSEKSQQASSAELEQLTCLLHNENEDITAELAELAELADVLADDTAGDHADSSTQQHPYEAADIDLDIDYILADVAQNTSNSVIKIDEQITQITKTDVKATQETAGHLTKSLEKPAASHQPSLDIITPPASHAAPDSEAQLVMRLFLEDVPELLADLEQAFDAVQQCAAAGTLGNRENADLIQNLERQLHTIKGGARMANC
ncbi:MAG TPA: hypothetical protein ENK78_03405, partial [Thiothrix sp.]|nr:hypothetical protein [Thiothrix sp.]